MATAPSDPWFAGKEGTVLFFRVNRRPMTQPTIFSDQPESVFDHIAEVLLFGDPETTSGKGGHREWLLGNREINTTAQTISGQIGWETVSTVSSGRFDHERNSWVDITEEQEDSVRAPFVFESKGRVLAILKHSSFTEKAIPSLFEKWLRKGEMARAERSTEWAVEPILDKTEFYTWMREVPAVNQVTLVARLPNPSAQPDFEPVWSQMDHRKAGLLKEIMEAADPRLGLQALEEDDQVRAFVAMGGEGFGYVTAKGRGANGRATTYDSRERVSRATTEPLPSDWKEAVGVLFRIARRRRQNAT